LNIYPASAENIIAMLMEQNYLKEKMPSNPLTCDKNSVKKMSF